MSLGAPAVVVVVGVLVLAVAVLGLVQVGLLARAARAVGRHRRRLPFSGREDTYRSPLTPGVTVVLPTRDDEEVVVDAVHAVLALRYPALEIVVVDHGSGDDTVAVLEEAFGLREYPRVVPDDLATRGEVQAVLAPSGSSPLSVVRTAPAGRASAVHTGINAARHGLVCVVDARTLLDPEALLAVIRPFTDDPETVVAAGAGVRAAGGARVESGRVVAAPMPRGLLGSLQVVERLRAVVLGSAASSSAGALALPDTFRLLRRDVVVDSGGLDLDGPGAEAELVVRMHRRSRSDDRPHRMVVVAEPVAWARVPGTWRAVARAHRAATAGLLVALRRDRELPPLARRGRLRVLPLHVALEVAGPLVELAALVAVLVALGVGAVDGDVAVLVVLTLLGLGVLVSLAVLTVEELAFPRSPDWADLAAAVGAAVVAPLGFRQLSALARLAGVVDGLRHRPVSATVTGGGLRRAS